MERRGGLSFAEAVADVLRMGEDLVARGQGDYLAAMLLDLRRRRLTEVDATVGRVVRLGETLGVPTPHLETAWRLVRGIEGTYRGGG